MLTSKIQAQAIKERLRGLTLALDPRYLEEPWLTCWQALEAAQPGQEWQTMVEALHTKFPAESGEILRQLTVAQPLAPANLAELAPQLPKIQWFWPKWFARGMLNLLGSAPGVGKSLLMLYLAYLVIHGKKFPDGQPVPNPGGKVLYVDAENVPQLLNERAQAWQMDLSKLYLMTPDLDEILDLGQPKYKDRLVETVYALRPELLIVDSLSGISLKGENSIEDVRPILSFLSSVAREFETCLILCHHIRKRGNFQMQADDLTADDFRGSSHILATARTVIGLSIVQTEKANNPSGPRKMTMLKTSLGPYPPALGFEVVPLFPTGVTLQWGSPPAPYREPTKAEECQEWLRDLLLEADKPLAPKEIVEWAKNEGFSRATVFAAYKQLKPYIGNTEGRKSPTNAWYWKPEFGEESQESQSPAGFSEKMAA